MTNKKDAVPAHLWRISNSDYDLSSFLDQHPGGPIALGLGMGEDCTDLFKSYHFVNPHAYEVLKKYKVDKTTPAKPLEETPFMADLRKMVREHFKGQGKYAHKATLKHKILCGGFCLLTLVFTYYYLRGSYLAIPFMIMAHWLLFVNTSHDGSHFAFSSKWWINHALVFLALPWMYNPYTWYHQHVVTHHVKTNVHDEDCDLWHFWPVRMHHHNEVPAFGGFENCLKIFLSSIHLGFVTPFNAIQKDENRFGGEGGIGVAPESWHLMKMPSYFRTTSIVPQLVTIVWYTVPMFFCLCIYDTWTKAILMAILPYAVSSILFILYTQVSHIQEECQKNDMVTNTDFFKNQACTSLNYSVNSKFWCFMSGGLNVQSLHHVLPWVSSCHFTDMYPKFKAVCQKHKVVLKETPNLWTALSKLIQHVINLNTKPDTWFNFSTKDFSVGKVSIKDFPVVLT